MSRFLAIAVIAVAALAIQTHAAVILSDPSTFCEVWADDSTTGEQEALISYLVSSAILGNTTKIGYAVAVPGLIYKTDALIYFNGSRGGDNYAAAGALRTGLIDNLNLFFQAKLGCRLLEPDAADMQIIRFGLNNSIVWTEFKAQFQLAARAKGVPVLDEDTPTTSEVTYLDAVLTSLELDATAANSICATADCTAFVPLGEFNSARDGDDEPLWIDINDSPSHVVTIPVGGNVVWRMLASTFHVIQTDDAYVALDDGWGNTDTNSTVLTVNFDTAGTFYFKSSGETSAAKGIVVVSAPAVPAEPRGETIGWHTYTVAIAPTFVAVVAGYMIGMVS